MTTSSLISSVDIIISTKHSVNTSTHFQSNASESFYFSPYDFFNNFSLERIQENDRNIYFLEYYQSSALCILNKISTVLTSQGFVYIPIKIVEKYSHFRITAGRLGYEYKEVLFSSCKYLMLQRKKIPKWQFMLKESYHEDEIRTLFLEVFKHELSSNLWKWKYSEGRGVAVIGKKEGKLVSHYGGLKREVMIASLPALALQIGDVMVKSSERGILTRNGLFFQTCATFLEQYIGDNKTYQLGFGFPTRRSMDLAKKQGLYEQVDHLIEKQWTILKSRPSLVTNSRPLKITAGIKLQTKVNHLWLSMLRDFNKSIIGIRDWDYIKNRYLEHPEKQYSVYLISSRFTRKSIGVIILSREGERCRIMDLIGPIHSFSILIHHARRLTYELGAQQLFGWLPNSHRDYWANGEENGLDICIPTNIWTQSSNVNQTDLSWWLTAGDTDFC